MFTFPALLWFLPLAGLVVLIHLINMFRHRPVPWAAMEFLLAGYKKSRVRILMQQLLLMLLRTLAVVVLILMLAGPRLLGPLADLFGGRPTHHIVLLDDSYSMSERNATRGGHSVFDDTLGTVRQILRTSVHSGGADRLTLITASQARKIALGEEPDFAERPLDEQGRSQLETHLLRLDTTDSAAGPEALLHAAKRVLQDARTGNKPVVYLLSDFRRRDWDHPEPLLKTIDEIRGLGGMVRAIRCLDGAQPNVTLRDARLVEGVRAADIEMLLDATLINYGPDDIENLHLSVSLDDRPQPGQTLPLLKAGETTPPPLRFPVRFQGGGEHRIRLQTSPDAVAADNVLALALDIPEAVEVLLIAPEFSESGESRRENERAPDAVRNALAPGDVRSGIRVRVETPRFLAMNSLNPYRAVFLLDVPQLDKGSVRALEDYLRGGGGVAIFLGPNTNERFINEELYRNGEGFFPVRLEDVRTLAPDFLTKTADISVADHPVFRLFGSGESPLLAAVKVDRYFASADTDIPEGDSRRRVLARLRNGSALVVEHLFGEGRNPGRCIVFTTTASTEWNTWGRSGSFVVTLLDLAAYLSQRPETERSLPLEAPISLALDPSVYTATVRIIPPAPEDPETPRAEPVALEAVLDADGLGRIEYGATDRPGFYEAVLTRHDGSTESRTFAVHVDPAEGDTRLPEVGVLAELLRKSEVRLENAASFSGPLEFTGARSLADLLLLVLAALLAGEMFLAGRIIPPSPRPGKGRT